jgi:TRAP-type C4-dicarboxylate transport system permease small subunit
MGRETRTANLLMLLSALLFLMGIGALVLVTGGQGWADLASATRQMVGDRWQLVLVLAVLLCGLTVALLVVVNRSTAAALRERRPVRGVKALPAGPPKVEAQGERGLVRRARRALDIEICRSRPQVDRVVDALLNAPADFQMQRVCLEPGETAVEVSLGLGDKRFVTTTIPPLLYEQVLEQLREMIGTSNATGDGMLDLRSSTSVHRMLVRLQRHAGGVQARLELVSDDDEDDGDVGPIKKHRSKSVVFRFERSPSIAEVVTGEFPIPPMEEHDGTDPGAGMLTGLGPSGETEVAPLVAPARERTVGRTEVRLRLVLGLLMVGATVLTFWNAFGWAAARAAGRRLAPWRDVPIQVTSTPLGGEVVIAGTARGRTPLTVREPCRGRAIEVLVRAEGFSTWQWSGICPASGVNLSASLKPLR